MWQETDSQLFIDVGRIHTPSRDEIAETFLALLPASADDPFLAVELCPGEGWLSGALLERYPKARIIGLDGSEVMLRQATETLAPFSGRFELRRFRLEDESWRREIPPVRAFLSCLAIHHLNGPQKRALYAYLFDRLEPGGALLICDLIAPASKQEHQYLADAWDQEVRRQALELTGKLDVYEQFRRDHLNWYRYPDPMDMPSTIPEHLAWLTEADFAGATVFWERAGHAIYGGYKPGR